MSRCLRLGVIGGGYGIRVLVPAVMRLPHAFELAAIHARNASFARAAADDAGARSATIEEILADPTIDAVVVALPPRVQGELLVKGLRTGKHFFCEKPLADSLATARAIDELRAPGQVVVVDFGFRQLPAFRAAFRWLRQSQTAPIHADVEWLLDTRRDPTLTYNWKSSLADGGGTVRLMGSHVIDYLRWLIGEIVAVQGEAWSLVQTRPDPSDARPIPVTADDTALATLTFAGGARASVRLSTAFPLRGGHRIRLSFDGGELEITQPPGADYYDAFSLAWRRGASAEPTVLSEATHRARIDMAQASLQGFRNSIETREGETFEAAMAVQAVIEQWAPSVRRSPALAPVTDR